MISIFKKVFETKRLPFKEKFQLSMIKIPLMITNVLVKTVYFKYFTDVIGINPFIVGTAFLIFGIWNAINDILIGMYLDKVPYNPKKGKYLRYMKLSIPILTISSLGMLLTSNAWSDAVILIYLTLMLVIYEVGYTFYEISMESYRFLRVHDSKERIELSIITSYMIYIFSMILTLVPIYLFVGNQPINYIKIAVVAMVLLNAVLYLIVTFTLKERREIYENASYNNENLELTKDFWKKSKSILTNKGFWILQVGRYLALIAMANYFAYLIYYMDDILNATPTITLIMDIGSGVLMFLIMPFVPTFYKKIGLKNSAVLCLIPAIIGYSILFFTNSVYVAGACFGLVVMSHGIFDVIQEPFHALVIDEDWQITGEKKVGFINALRGLLTKPAAGVRSFIIGVVLSYYGYNGMAEVQTEQALHGLRIVSSLIPLVCVVVIFITFALFLPYNNETEKAIVAKRLKFEKDMEDNRGR